VITVTLATALTWQLNLSISMVYVTVILSFHIQMSFFNGVMHD